MTQSRWQRLLELADETPASRDRLMDFLRVLSICVVVLGHYFMAAVYLRHNKLTVDNSIAHIRYLWIATWMFQVMPLFFFVGGFANYTGLTSIERKGLNFGDFLVGRIKRLLQPVVVFLVVAYILVLTLLIVGIPHATLRPMAKLATQLLWFIGVYLLVVLFAGVMFRIHRRYGVKAIAAGVLFAIAIDVLRFNSHVEVLGYLNVLAVWLTIHQFGYLYADGTLQRLNRSFWLATVVFMYACLIVLTTWGPYPHSMVGLPNEKLSNMNPPSVCILLLGIAQVGITMFIRGGLDAWLARRRVWATVIFLNLIIMTIFLWHLPALMLTTLVLLSAGLAQPTIGTTYWWWLRFVWVLAPLIPLWAFISVFSRFERVNSAALRVRSRVGMVTIGAIVLILGVLGFAVSGLYGIGPRATGKLVFVEVGPLLNGLHVLIGLALLSIATSTYGVHKRLLYLVLAILSALGLSGILVSERNKNNVFALSLSTAIVHLLLLAAVSILAWRHGVGSENEDSVDELSVIATH